MDSFEKSIRTSHVEDKDKPIPQEAQTFRTTILDLGSVGLSDLKKLMEQGNPSLRKAVHDELTLANDPASEVDSIQDQRQ